MADGDSGVVGDDSLVQRQNSLVSGLQPTNLQKTNLFILITSVSRRPICMVPINIFTFLLCTFLEEFSSKHISTYAAYIHKYRKGFTALDAVIKTKQGMQSIFISDETLP